MAVITNNPAVQPRRFTPSHVSVEAMQLDGSSAAIAQWLASHGGHYSFVTHPTDATLDRLTVATPRGPGVAQLGDWIVRGVTGLFFVLTAQEFAATYTEVTA
jgi:hypothetical protein